MRLWAQRPWYQPCSKEGTSAAQCHPPYLNLEILGNHFLLSDIRHCATTPHISLSSLSSLPPLIVIMASESLSVFNQLDFICQRIAQIEWRHQEVALLRKASNNLRKLSVDLEEPGDLIDRSIYQVGSHPSVSDPCCCPLTLHTSL